MTSYKTGFLPMVDPMAIIKEREDEIRTKSVRQLRDTIDRSPTSMYPKILLIDIEGYPDNEIKLYITRRMKMRNQVYNSKLDLMSIRSKMRLDPTISKSLYKHYKRVLNRRKLHYKELMKGLKK